MSEETRRSITRTHSNNSNNLIQPPGSGTETIRVKLTDKFTRYTIDLLTPIGVSGCEVINRPSPGSSGNQTFRVRWHYFPHGRVTYRLNVYTGKRGPVTIVVDSHDWVNKARDAINQNLAVNMVVRGIQARDLYRQILLLAPSDIHVPADLFFEPDDDMVNDGEAPVSDFFEVDETPSGPMEEPISAGAVTLGLGIVGGLVVVAGFATVAAILMMAMQKGFVVDAAGFKAKTPVGDYEITFRLRPGG